MQNVNTYSFNADTPLEKYRKSDMGFLIAVVLLWGLGIFTLFICSQSSGIRRFDDAYYFVKRQLICSAVGFIGFLFFALCSMNVIRKVLPVLVIFTVILCFLTFVPGISAEKNGARRWVKMPMNFTFQPSELGKFAVILFLANRFDKLEKIENPEEKSVLQCVIGLGLMVTIVFCQKDFSTGLFILALGILMFFVSGTKLSWIFPFAPLLLAVIVLLVTLEPYRMDRIMGYIRPHSEAATINYQSLASKRAITSGGLLGNGIGSDLIKMNSIPEVQADYIFAGWTEAFGLIGVIIYFGLLGFFAWRGVKIAFSCRNRFASYASFGCVASIVFQSIMNCSVVCGILPTTGIPLPFFSMGGSSIIVTLIMCGFVLNASRCDDDEEDFYFIKKKNNKDESTEYINVTIGDL